MEYIEVVDARIVLEAEKAAERGDIEQFLTANPIPPVWVLNSDVFINVIERDDDVAMEFLVAYCMPGARYIEDLRFSADIREADKISRLLSGLR